MTNYSKPALSRADQIALLESRGLHINDKTRADNVLAAVSYYRLRAYMLPLQVLNDPAHTFKPNIYFENIVALYEFDRTLRGLVFDAIERIEIAFRTQIIYHLSLQQGAWWFEDDTLFSDTQKFQKNLVQLHEEIDRSHEVFIDHYKSKYTMPERPPAWMSLEVSSIGLLSKIYRNLKKSPAKKEVAQYFAVDARILESWLQSTSYMRNICAHHSRLWNRHLTIKPTLPKHPQRQWLLDTAIDDNRIYALLSCMVYLLESIDSRVRQTFASEIATLVRSFPSIPNLSIVSMGFPMQWQNEPLWRY